MDIAQPALATLGQHGLLAVVGQVGDQFAGHLVDNDRADRHAQDDVVRALAVAIGATATFAMPGDVLLDEAVVDQRVDILVGNSDHAAATTAVATVRATLGHELFAPHAGGAVAAPAADYFDFRFVNKLHGVSGTRWGCAARAGGAAGRRQCAVS